jgi:hypothetical protein
MLRLLMTSTAYRQASSVAPISSDPAATASPVVDPQTVDPGNQLLWHQRLRRLESEAVRDAILATAGTLDRTQFGPPTLVESRPDGSVVIKATAAGEPPPTPRRSIYILARRNYHLSMLGTFDQPVVATNCPRRNNSAVVLQSLTMLNDDFVIEQAGRFAARIAADLPAEKQIAGAFQWALSRAPNAQEIAWSEELLSRQASRYRGQSKDEATARTEALAHLCQMLLSTSEFLYVQ